MPNAAYMIRTLAFAPAHDPEAVFATASSGLDSVCLDMEDLTPRDEKEHARELFPKIAAELRAQGTVVMARTNGLDEGCAEDLHAIVGPDLHCVNIPKTESAEQVVRFCELLDDAERANGVEPGSIHVRPVIETAKGLKWSYEIAAASDRIEYMGGVTGTRWGDYGATLGLIESPDATETLYLRSKILTDVRAAGLRFPIGGGPTARMDLEFIREFTLQNKHLGYTGSYVIARRDIVETVHAVYTPTTAEIEDWQELVPLLESAEAEGKVAFKIGTRILDTASLGWIRERLDLARRLGLVSA